MWKDGKMEQVTVREVLDFLTTSYHVHEAVEGSSVRVDWEGLACNPLLSKFKDKEFEKEEPDEIPVVDEPVKVRRCNSLDAGRRKDGFHNFHRQTSVDKNAERRGLEVCRQIGKRKSITNTHPAGGKAAERYIKAKLNQVLQEGILDSVLPYILSRQQQSSRKPAVLHEPAKIISKKICETTEKTERIPGGLSKKDLRRRSNPSVDGKSQEKKDVDVVIHVCDEVKNMRKDFKCSQSLLLSQMKYFAQVTTGQRLEDMDISVHCDIYIFDWLIRWVKQEGSPTLDSSIVIPVLMSSAFLQMDALQHLCLEFCKSHINEIIRDSSNLGCVNESVLTRLANLFSNTDVEAMKDRKDKLLSKLYCKFIMFLTEPVPEERRGHFATIAYLFRCIKCGKLINESFSSLIACVPKNLRMNQEGRILSRHLRDTNWTLSEFIRNLKAELKTWRKVYWRLWGITHHLICSVCSSAFPLYHVSWCTFHSESAQFFSMEHQRAMSFPVGRFPCCGEKAFRYEILPFNTGCTFRDHVPTAHSDKEQAILKIYKQHRELIRIEPSVEKDENRSKDSLWWEGLELAPSRTKQGLLGSFLDSVAKRSSGDQKSTRVTTTPTPSVVDNSSCSDSSDSESSGTGGDSEESYHATVRVTTKPRGTTSSHQHLLPARKDGGRVWVSKLSTRCNQDNQREFEEKAIRQMEMLLSKRTAGDTLGNAVTGTSYHDPPGGTYVKLEAEWREAHCTSHGCPGSSKLRLTPPVKPKTKR